MAKKEKALKVWTVHMHRKTDVTDTYIENLAGTSLAEMKKQAKKAGFVIDKAVLKKKK